MQKFVPRIFAELPFAFHFELERKLGSRELWKSAWQIERAVQLILLEDSGLLKQGCAESVLRTVGALCAELEGAEETSDTSSAISATTKSVSATRFRHACAVLLDRAVSKSVAYYRGRLDRVFAEKWTSLFELMQERWGPEDHHYHGVVVGRGGAHEKKSRQERSSRLAVPISTQQQFPAMIAELTRRMDLQAGTDCE